MMMRKENEKRESEYNLAGERSGEGTGHVQLGGMLPLGTSAASPN